jgi:hypothetical protein
LSSILASIFLDCSLLQPSLSVPRPATWGEHFVKVVPRFCYGFLEVLRPRVEGRLYCLYVYLCFINHVVQFFSVALHHLVDAGHEVLHPIFYVYFLALYGLHLLMTYMHLGFHFLLSGCCPGLVDIYLWNKSKSKDLKLIIIRV